MTQMNQALADPEGMTSVTGMTAAAMQAIRDGAIVGATINGSGHLILTKNDASTIDAGAAKGATGNTGPTGPAGAGVIPGQIVMYGSATIPSGYLQCGGQAVSRTTYAALFAAIGTTWGAGDGSTTFNLPAFANRFPRGSVTGQVGGADAHTHSHTSHSHPLSSNGQALVSAGSGVVGIGPLITVGSWTEAFRVTGSAGTASGRTAGVALAGATDATTPPDTNSASNVPAYLGVNFLIKT